MYLDVRKNFEEKVSYVARRINGMVVDDQSCRRRGIGSAMFQHLLQDAKASNRRFSVLQASKDGLGIYLKAGFRIAGDVLTFERRNVFTAGEPGLQSIR